MSQDESERTYFQDGLHGNHCFGCGAWNDKGLRIKSFWDGDESVCVFEPEPHHAAMPPDVMNGGTIATVIDCHSVCSAMADAYRTEGREVGEGNKIWYATASLTVNYRKPTPIDGPVTARARLIEKGSRKTLFAVDLFSHKGVLTCDATVLSLRVPDEWADPTGLFQHLE
ncbi:MAG TPA: PaaI family thioesterase [Dehalococcoidia bacterium]|jgi:acyl-coenzyme A thioesterase PaaI-like protein|nr:thioesterase [Dehalococcoidia bacterium]MEE2841847.1 PaaI family thioesterase [Chloroflexota bacterium]MQG29976.1 PaaI family thioesterase [SAR202 cluster bacterium]HAG56335.1 PaaI family thioesterase [Dehalococcoidia bacterium]HIM59548.1 PaaI family thioesterase [Dehalococcoidia bacterium]